MEIDSILYNLEQGKDASLFAEFEDLEDCHYVSIKPSDIEGFDPTEYLDIDLGEHLWDSETNQ